MRIAVCAQKYFYEYTYICRALFKVAMLTTMLPKQVVAYAVRSTHTTGVAVY